MGSDGRRGPRCPQPGLLVRVIGETVPLTPFDHDDDRQRGACAFHPDQSASLYALATHWYCFAYQAGGDVVRWIMRRDVVGEAEARTSLKRYSDQPQFNVRGRPGHSSLRSPTSE